MRIDIEALRQDMIDECYAAAFGAGIGAALLDTVDIERMNDDELIRTAQEYGFNLKYYKI